MNCLSQTLSKLIKEKVGNHSMHFKREHHIANIEISKHIADHTQYQNTSNDMPNTHHRSKSSIAQRIIWKMYQKALHNCEHFANRSCEVSSCSNRSCSYGFKFAKKQGSDHKYAVIKLSNNKNPCCFKNESIEQIKQKIYECRYVIYINRINILNDMKQFLKQSGFYLKANEIKAILQLIDTYNDLVNNDEI